MKKLLILLLFPLYLFGQTTNQNYIRTKVYKTESTQPSPQIVDGIVYYDGLYRPIQSITANASGNGKDVVQPVVYEAGGRQLKQYLPYVNDAQTSSSLNYQNNTSVISGINTMYLAKFPGELSSTAPNPYSEVKLESSSLGRVQEMAAPGSDWSMTSGAHTIKYEYDVTPAFSQTDDKKVYRFVVTFANGDYTQPSLSVGQSAQGMYQKTVIHDENWTAADGDDKTRIVYTDNLGRTVLERRYAGTSQMDTYYVYDIFGNLTYVLTPKAMDALIRVDETPFGSSYTINAATLAGLCYTYKYDSRNRVIEKRVPDKGNEYFVYDKLNRVVFSQTDVNITGTTPDNKWLFSKYDIHGRIAYTGFHTNSATRATLQAAVDAQTSFNESKATATTYFTNGGIDVYYTNSVLPTANIEVLTVNYTDDYVFNKAGMTVPATTAYHTTTTATKGLPTGSVVKILDNASPNIITTILGYDAKANAIYAANTNPYYSTNNIIEAKVDFTAQVQEMKTRHTRSSTTLTLIDKFTYDAIGRPLQHTQNINGGAYQLIALNAYDNIGRLIQKKTGDATAPWQTVDYGFNLRGWLKNINDTGATLGGTNGADLFAFKINYNTKDNTNSVALYNGNIAETAWKTANDNKLRMYSYVYDGANRLKDATYITPSGTSENFTESVTNYDKNGNIRALSRWGFKTSTSTYEKIDQLTYSYTATSNQILRVADATAVTDGFKDGATAPTEYTYTADGNMKSDLNKGITLVEYNYFNQPTKVTFTTGEVITYVYDALGNKMKKTLVQGSTTTYSEYNDGFIYKKVNSGSSDLQYFSIEGGYVTKDLGVFKYVFQYTDHLGNVRMSYTKDGSGNIAVVEDNQYYPFGLKHQGYSLSSTLGNELAGKLKFNGQEYEQAAALNMYEMDFRQYDPALGRFHAIDLLAEYMPNMSPYSFGFDNPVAFTDASGLFPTEGAAYAYMNATGVRGAVYKDPDGQWWINSNGVYYTQNSNGDVFIFDLSQSQSGENSGDIMSAGYGGSGASGSIGNWTSNWGPILGTGFTGLGGNGVSGLPGGSSGGVLGGTVGSNGAAGGMAGGSPTGSAGGMVGGSPTGSVGGSLTGTVGGGSGTGTTLGSFAGVLDGFQNVMDVIGTFDPTGIADGINAAVYLARGDYQNAAIAAIAILPFGDVAKGYKFAVRGIQKHHIIPKAVYKKIPELKNIMKLEGGHNLKKIPTPFHGNHPKYNDFVTSRIMDLERAGNLNSDAIQALQRELSEGINKAYDVWREGGGNLNDYFKIRF